MKSRYRKMLVEQALHLCETRLQGVEESIIRWAKLEGIIKRKKSVALRLFILLSLQGKRLYLEQSRAVGKLSPNTHLNRKKEK